MLKKILYASCATTFAAAIGLSLINTAYAGGPDVVKPAVAPASKPQATKDVPHAYFQALLGYSKVNYKVSNFNMGIAPTSIKTAGIAFAVAVGFNFNQYFGLELGSVWFYKPELFGLPGVSTFAVMKNNVLYFAPKLMWHINKTIGLFAFAGIGYVARGELHAKTSSGFIPGVINYAIFVKPVYGAGMTYQIAQHWSLVAKWVQAPGNRQQNLPVSNFFGVGGTYHFFL